MNLSANTKAVFEYDCGFLPRVTAGTDEAGRGPLAGPVVAACVIMPLDKMIDGIFDSKKVSEKKRESLYGQITDNAITYGIGVVDHETIDKINILNATKQAMKTAFDNMKRIPDLLLVDAVKGLEFPCEILPIIKGDATSYNIAAASILAKVTRDRIMREYDAEYPEYGFARNKGYGTAEHIAAIKRIGSCSIHRNTFIGNFTKETRVE